MSIYAIATGNWSNPAIWNTGVLPVAGDVVRPNNFIVTMDVNATVTEIRNDAGGGAVIGGRFTLSDGVTVTATNGFYGTYGSAASGLLNYSGAGSVILNGNIEGSKSAVTNTSAINNNSTGTITINGNISSSGAGATAFTLRNLSTGTLIVNGDIVGFSGTLAQNGSGTLTIIGNVTQTGGNLITNATGIVTITGDVSNSSGSAIIINSSGTITISGLVTLNTAGGNIGSITNISGVITITGDVISSATNTNVRLISQSGAGVINIIGNITAPIIGNNAINRVIENVSNGTINITGNVIAGGTNSAGTPSFSIVIDNGSVGIVNVTGSVQGPSGGAQAGGNTVFGIRNNTGVVNIVGNCIGTLGFTNIQQAVGNIGIGTVNITGNAIGGSTGLAVVNTSTGTINLNGNAVGGTGFQAIEGVNAAGNTIIEKAIYTAQGQSPISGYIKFKTTNPEIDVLREDNVIVTLRDPLNVSGLLPAITNVRAGVIYNTGNLTGTLAMPAANLVQLGVPVDNTVGTGNLTPADFWDYLISNGFVAGSMGERLKNASTVDTTGAQIAGFIV